MKCRARKYEEDFRVMWLEDNEDGGVTLYIEDPTHPSDPWAVLSITKRGTCLLHHSVGDNSGLQLDDEDRIYLEQD